MTTNNGHAPNRIYRECDLSKFKLNPQHNRALDPRHVQRLINAIRENNLLSERPIEVTPDLEVIDGQHRLKAAEALGVCIYYRVTTRLKWHHLGRLNADQKKWTLQNYLAFWKAQGLPEYIRLHSIAEDIDELNLSQIVQMASGVMIMTNHGVNGKGRHGWRVAFEQGEWVAEDYAPVHLMAAMLRDIQPYYGDYKRRAFINAFATVMRDPRYDHQRLLDQLETYGTTVALRHSTRATEYVDQLRYAYNYNRKGTNRIHDLGDYRLWKKK